MGLRPQPRPRQETLYPGVEYTRQVARSPRPMVIHILKVDLQAEGISFLVTPGDAQAERPVQAMTAAEFARRYDLQIAVNGDGFTPWHDNGPLDTYPRSGDRVTPVGLAASRGEVYSQPTDDEPTLYLSRANQARFGTPTGKVYNAISGNLMLVQQGQALSGLQGSAEPRTALGIDRKGRWLIIVVVDGRQPGYSEGATLAELAEILLAQGAQFAMNMDGGGSSTLVARGRLLNSPVNHGIPGWQRPVGSHLGVYAGGG
ncbi:MAG: phosphodiester glycosidase family protein [Chloroflexi bacterium]|nr:phosphodiester glycosidase family protein [Chloroflexota bacterium]